MIKDDDREALIKYRIEQANEAIREVEILMKNDLLKVAVNRIYYGMFYMINCTCFKT